MRARNLVPGLAASALAVVVSMLVNAAVPVLSALLVAILLGILAANLLRLPASLAPGLQFASKRLLRIGIVLLGLQLAVGDIVALGLGTIVVVVAVVTIGMFATCAMGRRMGMTAMQSLLMASGFSICGAAAVAAAGSVVDAEEEDVATALAMVVLFGTVVIPLVPLFGRLFGLDDLTTGLWAGASVHEVAQVVAIGGSISAAALSAAVVVKLARVLMLAPVMAVLSWRRRRTMAGLQTKLPPIVPLFVAGFIAMVALRSVDIVPGPVLDVVKWIQTALLAAAMFALGTGIKASIFKRVGSKPLVLGAASTTVVGAIGLGGVLLLA